jgi:hypothetical protein
MTVFMVKMLENDDPYDPITSSSICVPRALPIECQACRVMLDSYPALIAHWSHRQNMDEARGRLVPEEFVDPRNTESYDDDRLTLDQDGIDRMVQAAVDSHPRESKGGVQCICSRSFLLPRS